MQPCMRLLLLLGESQTLSEQPQARDERRVAGEIHRGVYQLANHAAGAFHLAWRGDVDAPAFVLQEGDGAATEVCTRANHRQLHTDQRNPADRRVVRILQSQQLAGGGLYRRTAGVSRRVSQEQARKTFVCKGDAGHQLAEKTWCGVERDGGGE